MKSFRFDNFSVTLEKKGRTSYTKASYPTRYGTLSEIKTPGFIYHFDPNGELRFIQGCDDAWPNRVEWLKRTLGNDWVYYSSGGYGGVFSCMGEYYVPCLPYGSISILDAKPFARPEVNQAIDAWPEIVGQCLSQINGNADESLRSFVKTVWDNDARVMEKKAKAFHAMTGGPISVLPPDVRHVDYDVIPVILADGCLYNCGFCSVKSGMRFTPRTRDNIVGQIKGMTSLLGESLHNYNSIFLGQHDALNAPPELIRFAVEKAFDEFDFRNSYMEGANIFMFGSVHSFLNAPETLFAFFNSLPCKTYINLGFESADPETLKYLNKPISREAIEQTFHRLMAVNRKYGQIEITMNFLLGPTLPPGHIDSIVGLLRDTLPHPYPKGTVYLSPLTDYEKKRHLRDLIEWIKIQSRLPVFAYLIQRL